MKVLVTGGGGFLGSQLVELKTPATTTWSHRAARRTA
jgi:uncharacterized protein YbjT (DUF2867 family)